MSLTSQLCERIVASDYASLGTPAIAAARRLVLDGIAVAVAGSAERAVRILLDHCREQGGAPQATTIGSGLRLGLVSVAACNGAAMHVLDFEPMWSPANHALSTTLPAALALAERDGRSGRELLTALAKGVELQGWIRQASGQFEARALRFHPPGAVGPLGAATAAAHLLGLDPGRLAHALGIAASRAAGLLANAGTMTKATHCGHAAASGLEAALLAERGFSANADVFAAAHGYAEAFYDDFRQEELKRFGPPWRMVAPGYAIKMFPSQFATHFAITAALELRAGIGAPGRIRRVVVTAPPMDYIDRPRPSTGLEGKFSLQYTTATALLDGSVGLDSFRDARLERQDMQELLGKIAVRVDPEIPARFEQMHIALRVELEGGRALESRCLAPRGAWGTPPISDGEHLVKVRDCLATQLTQDTAERVIALAQRIDDLDGAGLRELLRLAAVPEKMPRH